ncbi:MAG: hypothetical protein M3R49_01900 [Chloroflexota bacterium]|nr:hypothetical protein [Chloroflexota bacterium]
MNARELVGEQLVGRYAVGSVDRGGRPANEVGVPERDPSIGADDHDVPLADWHCDRMPGIVGTRDLDRP